MGQKLAQWGRVAAGARLKRTALALAVTAVFIGTPAQAAKWTVTPSIRVQETFTNNVDLAESGDEEWDLVTEVQPGIFLRGQGDRLNLLLDYRANAVTYMRDMDRNRIDHRLNGKATYEAIRDFFFVDTGATMSQQLESPFGSLAVDSTNDTGNRYTARSYYIAPYVQGRLFGGDSTYLLRNTHTWTDAGQSSAALSDAYINQWTGRFATPVHTFGLGLTYDRADTEYDNSDQELMTEIGRAIGYWRLDPQFILNARVGHERIESTFTETSDSIYGAGFQWFPTPRTAIEGFGEHRAFGTGYLFSLSHRRPLSTWRVRASRDLSTYPQNLFTLQEGSTVELLMNLPQFINAAPDDLILREQLVKQYIQLTGLPETFNDAIPFYSQQVQIVERQEASVALTGAQNTLIFTLYRVDSENFSPDTGPESAQVDALFGRHVEQRGASVSWTHRLSGRTRSNITLSRTEVKEDQPFDRESMQDMLRAMLTTELSPNTSGWVGGRLVDFNGKKGSANDYREAAVFVGFTHRF